MKNIIILVIALAIKLNTSAQTMVTAYDTCRHYAQYQGEWMYANGNDTIRIYLKKVRTKYIDSDVHTSIIDGIIGWHEYKSGNTIIESNYQNRFIQLPSVVIDSIDTHSSIYLIFDNSNRLVNGCNINSLRFIGRIRDYNQSNENYDVTAILNTAKTIMTWKQQFSEWHQALTMTLPPNFILIKHTSQ
jgi:hypothetical protein